MWLSTFLVIGSILRDRNGSERIRLIYKIADNMKNTREVKKRKQNGNVAKMLRYRCRKLIKPWFKTFK